MRRVAVPVAVLLTVFAAAVALEAAVQLGPWKHARYTMIVSGLALSALAVRQARPGRAALLLACCALGIGFFGQNHWVLKKPGAASGTNLWGTFHYWLGAKYFDELGYDGLYTQALAADRAGGNRLADVQTARSLTTRRITRLADEELVRDEAFSDARWAEFQRDVDWFFRQKDKVLWSNVILDRGYNGSPLHQALVRGLSQVFSIRYRLDRMALLAVDLVLLLAAFALSCRAYGGFRSVLVFGAFVSWLGNDSRILGQIAIWDWFAASWAAVAALRLGWYGTAGLLVAYATGVRVFPIVLAAGPVIDAARSLARGGGFPRSSRRFLASLLVGLLLAGSAGALGSRARYAAWPAFAEHMQMHQGRHDEGARRVGLGHLLGTDVLGGMEGGASKRFNEQHMAANRPLLRGLHAALCFVLLAAMLRRDVHDISLLATALLWVGTVASRYYGSLWVLLLLFASAPRGPPRPLGLRRLDGALFALSALSVANPVRGEEDITAFVFSNALLFAWFTAILSWVLKAPSSESPAGSAADTAAAR